MQKNSQDKLSQTMKFLKFFSDSLLESWGFTVQKNSHREKSKILQQTRKFLS